MEEAGWWVERRRKTLIDVMRKILQDKKEPRILDAGCGPGGTSIHFLPFGIIFGTDFSISALRLAVKKGLQNVFRSTLTSLPIQNEVFDVIIALDVLEHFENDSKVLMELKKSLKQDGFLIITVPAFQFLWSEHDVALSHFRRYNISTLTKVLHDSGFEVIRVSYLGSLIFPMFAIYRILTRFRVKKENPKPTDPRFPQFINHFLEKIMSLEIMLSKRFNLPFGISIICLAKKYSFLNNKGE